MSCIAKRKSLRDVSSHRYSDFVSQFKKMEARVLCWLSRTRFDCVSAKSQRHPVIMANFPTPNVELCKYRPCRRAAAHLKRAEAKRKTASDEDEDSCEESEESEEESDGEAGFKAAVALAAPKRKSAQRAGVDRLNALKSAQASLRPAARDFCDWKRKQGVSEDQRVFVMTGLVPLRLKWQMYHILRVVFLRVS